MSWLKNYMEIPWADMVLEWYDKYIDSVLGVFSILIFAIAYVIEGKISEEKEISNMLREEYDNRVFGMERNLFAYDYSNAKEYLKKASRVSDYYKYEVWYEEIFCEDIYRNTICSQMDNVIYTYFIYEDVLKQYRKKLWFIVGGMILLVFVTYPIVNPLMVCLTVFELIQVTFEEINVSKDLISANKNLKNLIMQEESYEKITSNFPYYIRCLQDCVITNRNNGLFVPKKIRDKHLKENSEFYKELNEVKARYLDGDTTAMPASAEDLEVLSWDEKKTFTVKELQARLLTTLREVHDVFTDNGIPYLLDGGTLIGAVRKSGSGIYAVEEDCMDFLLYESGVLV